MTDRDLTTDASAHAPTSGVETGSVGSPTDDEQPEDADLGRLVHALSHSVRSPLVALKGFAGLLEDELDPEASETSHHFVTRIAEAGRRIEWRLDDLGRLLALHEQLPNRTWTDPVPLVEAIAAELKPALDETGMRILVSREAPLVHCDPTQLETALLHLIGNSLQHGTPSEPRHVQVRVEREGATTIVSVIDGGPGMDEVQRARAFEPFASAGERARRFDDRRESTGIGLALVRRIARAHGGDAHIESEPGRGTCVAMTFPQEAVAPAWR